MYEASYTQLRNKKTAARQPDSSGILVLIPYTEICDTMKIFRIWHESDHFGSLGIKQESTPASISDDNTKLLDLLDDGQLELEHSKYSIAGEEITDFDFTGANRADFLHFRNPVMACSPKSYHLLDSHFPGESVISTRPVFHEYRLFFPRYTIDCLDETRSIPRYVPGIARIMGYSPIAVDVSHIDRSLFFIAGSSFRNMVFCTEVFKDTVESQGLTGLGFASGYIIDQ